jgi:sulfate/thiosulfate transport system ATP-binding protein
MVPWYEAERFQGQGLVWPKPGSAPVAPPASRPHGEGSMACKWLVHILEVANRVVVMREGRVEQIGTPEEVYEHPATPFVYHFLGNVNVFHGLVEDGQVHLGEFSLDLAREDHAHTTAAVAYARPHLLEIEHQPTERPQFRATIEYINAAGPLVKVELATETGMVVHVEMSQERYRQLGLHKGTEVFVSVKDMRVFPQTRHDIG